MRAPTAAPGGVVLGRVVGAHGLRGELRVRLLDESDNHLKSAPSIRLGRRGGDPKAVEARVKAVASGRRGEARLALEGVESREAAAALSGLWVIARSEHLAGLPPGEFYQYELVGCRVEDVEGRVLGVVRGVWETGAPDVLVIEAQDGSERLVPFAREIVRDVDAGTRRIVIDVPPGLLAPDDRG